MTTPFTVIEDLIKVNLKQEQLLRQALDALDCLYLNAYGGYTCSKANADKIVNTAEAIKEILICLQK